MDVRKVLERPALLGPAGDVKVWAVGVTAVLAAVFQEHGYAINQIIDKAPDLTADETVTGAWTFANDVTVDLGKSIYVYDATHTDYLRIYEQGTVAALTTNNNPIGFYPQGAASATFLMYGTAGNFAVYPLKIKESSAAIVDTTAYGQIWVKDDTPNILKYTDDAGGDWTPAMIEANETISGSWTFSGQILATKAATDGVTGAVYLQNSNPLIGFYESDQAADGKLWTLQTSSGHMQIYAMQDDGNNTNRTALLDIQRSGYGEAANVTWQTAKWNLQGQMYFAATLEDKISLYDDRLGGTTMYGFGVESSFTYSKGVGGHRWYINVNADGGTSDTMELTSSLLQVNADIGMANSTGDKITLWGTHDASSSYAIGIESNTHYFKAASGTSYFRWYVGSVDGGASDYMELSPYGLVLTNRPMHFRNSTKTAGTIHGLYYPNAAYFSTESSAQVGAYLIQLPAAVYGSQCMITLRVRHYNYTDGRTCDFLLGGYVYSAGAWHNTTATCRGWYGGTPIVRFVNNGSDRQGIIIGDVADSIDYPKWQVTDVTVSFSGQTYTNWYGDWSITKLTSLTGWTTVDTLYPLLQERVGGDGNSFLYINGPTAYANSKTNTGYIYNVTGNYGSIQVDGAAGSTSTWRGYSIGGRMVFMDDGSTNGGIYNDTDNEWYFYGTRNGETRMYYNGAEGIRTQDKTATGITSSGAVYDQPATLLDIGFNLLPAFNFNASDTLEASHCGHVTGKNNTTTTYTLTGPTSSDVDFPVGGVATVMNLGASGNYTIADTATCTMYYMDASSGAVTDIAGSGTLAPGGTITLYRYSTTAIYIAGGGFTP